MQLATLDIAIVVGYVVASLVFGLYLARRAKSSVEDFFVGGRGLPWWLAGTSMIASAFAIDTPFGITGLVAKHGVQGVWFAWSFAIGGAGTFGAFIFAALLRRSDIITTAELIELRYSGRGAALLRGFKGIYFGVLSLSISMGWVVRSVVVTAQEALGWNVLPTLMVIGVVAIAYTAVSGLWGVVVTDFVQFFVGAAGALALAYFAVDAIGGLDQLMPRLEQRFGAAEAARRMQFLPRPDDEFFHIFIVFVTLKWWGNPPAPLTQRIMSTRDDRHAAFAMMLFSVVHFALNYWPMILVALVSLVTYPELELAKAEQGYAMLLMTVLPPGVLGLSLAALTAAFMSTIDTQANTGASFMVNDIYRRFIKRTATEQHYVRASRICTVIMLGLAVVMFYFMGSVKAAWEYLATMIAGYGFVVVARWFWWRINAWSEMAALAGSAVGSLLANHLLEFSSFGTRFSFVAALSSAAWITTALVTPPPDLDRLAAFCRAVRPYPALWGPIRERYPDIDWTPQLGRALSLWLVGLTATFSICFGMGHLLIGSASAGGLLLLLAAVLVVVIARGWRRPRG